MKKGRSDRRATALRRLVAQVEVGTKNNKGETYPLSDNDKKRINKEIGILSTNLQGIETNV